MKKNLSKHLLLLMLAVFSMVSLTCCKDDNDNPKSNESRLVGTWVAEMYEDGDFYTLTLVLNKGGKGQFISSYDYEVVSDNISWSIRGENYLTIHFYEDPREDPFTEPFSLSQDGKTLYWLDCTFKKKK